jgi:hypothetical protein
MRLPCRAWYLVLEAKDMDREPATPALSPGDRPDIRGQMHDIRITNQIMYLHPPIEDCRYNLLQHLFDWQAVVTSQNRIQSTRYWLLILLIMIFAPHAFNSLVPGWP